MPKIQSSFVMLKDSWWIRQLRLKSLRLLVLMWMISKIPLAWLKSWPIWTLPRKVRADLKVNWHNTIIQLAPMWRCPIKCKMPSNLELELAKSKTTWWGWFHLQAWTQPSKQRITHLKNWHQKLNFRTFTTLRLALPTRSNTSVATKTSTKRIQQVELQALMQEMWSRSTPETR